MAFTFKCPGCRRKFRANKDLGGRLKRCGKCRRDFVIHADVSQSVMMPAVTQKQVYIRPTRGAAPAPLPERVSDEEAPEVRGAAFVTALAVLMVAAGGVALAYYFVDPWKEALQEITAAPPPPAAPRPPAVVRSSPVSPDSLVLRTDGTFLRGALTSTEAGYGLGEGVRRVDLRKDEVQRLFERAPAFIEACAVHLAELEIGTEEARNAVGRSREKVVQLLLELHRQRDRWTALQPVVRSGEVRGSPPLERLAVLSRQLEAMLEADLRAVADSAKATPEPGTPTVPAELAGLFALLEPPPSGPERPASAEKFRPLIASEGGLRDLTIAAFLLLSRSERDWAFETDRLEVKSDAALTSYSGILERQTPWTFAFRLTSGDPVTGLKEGGGWLVQMPGGITFDKAEVTFAPGQVLPSRPRLQKFLASFVPARWAAATSAEHLRAAQEGAQAIGRETSAEERGLLPLRLFVTAHAGAAMRKGGAAEIGAARQVLLQLGLIQPDRGSWQPAEEIAAPPLAALLKGGKPAEAASLLEGASGDHGFRWWYRAAAVRLLAPHESRDALKETVARIDRAIARAATEAEHRHLRALKESATHFRVCASCGGDAGHVCSTCKGKGQVTLVCSRCNGYGTIQRVGIGGGAERCNGCGGKPKRGQQACGRCKGKGTVSCMNCQGPFRLPKPEEIATSKSCTLCGGAGGFGDLIRFGCPRCAGLGVQLIPTREPAATLP